MALKGTGFLALWNDIEPARDAEYNLWHTREHVPERVSVPGILSGRRYVADASPHRYFTLYELDSPAVLETAPYKHLVDNPSPWSRSMRPDFRSFLRHPCATLASIGRGLGGAITTVRFALADGAPPVTSDVASELCRQLVTEHAELTNVHLGAVAASSSFTIGTPAANEERTTHVLLAEAHSAAALADLLPALSDAPLRLGATSPLQVNTYRLVFIVTAADLADEPTPVSR